MNRTLTWSAATAAVWMSAAALAGCGAAATPAEAPSSASPAAVASPEPGSLATADEALAELERAESELQQALGGPALRGELPAAPRAAAPRPSPQPPPAGAAEGAPMPPSRESADHAPSRKERAAEQSSASSCETACRALASMERAAQHLCGLAGDADPRCDGARTRVESAAARVAAQCPRCAGDD
ncbi:hypothetical protein WMF31_19020 [Sorangium sp. So ce1036]|uniref:hypothetical protein n=1 Tax=Sorangium sp. So ce1036 TaxID=3133328 RepID=UPI003F12ACBC